MKKNKKNIGVFSKCVLRTPLHPVNGIVELSQKHFIEDSDIKEFYKDEINTTAIYLASKDLYSSMIKWLNEGFDSSDKSRKRKEKTKLALIKYMLRMSTRSTPFGLFAGVSIININNKPTKIELDQLHKNSSIVRLDMDYLVSLAQNISRIKSVKEQLKYHTNNSLHKIGNNIRYVEYKYVNAKRTHQLISIENSQFIYHFLSYIKNGKTYDELLRKLEESDIPYNEAKNFINELIDSQIIISELEPTITGKDLLSQIITILDSLNKDRVINLLLSNLQDVNKELINLSKQPYKHHFNTYKKIISSLDELNISYNSKHLFQCDLKKSIIDNNLSFEITNDIIDTIGFLTMFRQHMENENATNFKEAFRKRYEEEEIPLLEALDPEMGIGYKNKAFDFSSLLKGIRLPQTKRDTRTIEWNQFQSILLKKYFNYLSNKLDHIVFTEKDLIGFKENWEILPNTFSCLVQLNKDCSSKQPIINFIGISGPSASILLSRFSHVDNNISNLVKDICTKDDELCEKGFINAEIVHLPESRVGNILARPHLRKYEIPYLSRSSINYKDQIPINDIYLSVRGNRILLRSKKLNKYINPKNSTAHNYSFDSLPIYNFLSDMQIQDSIKSIRFNWGHLNNELEYFPRVYYKSIIISLAHWKVNINNELRTILKSKDSENKIFRFQKFLKSKNVPDMVLLVENDNELFVNINNLTMLTILLETLKNRNSFVLKEFFQTTDSFIKNNTGKFSNEIIISFYNNNNNNIK